jgi:hypothetical protein
VNKSVVQNLPTSNFAESNGISEAPAHVSPWITQAHGNMVQARGQSADELHHTILHFAQSIRTTSNLMMLQAQSFQPLPTMPYAPRIHPAWPSPWLLPTPPPPPYSAAALHNYGAPQGTTPQTDARSLTLALAAKAGAAPLVTHPPLRF